MTFFIDGPRSETMRLVNRFQENQNRQDLTFERLIKFAKDEGDLFRAMAPRLDTPRPSARNPKPLAGISRILRAISRSPPPNQQVTFVHEETTKVFPAYEGVSEEPDGGEEELVVHETDPDNLIATSHLLSTIYEIASSAQDATDSGNNEQLI